MTEQTVAPAYLTKSGMIQTSPKCPNYKRIAEATGTLANKLGAVQLDLADAFTRIKSGQNTHCGMCAKIEAQDAAKAEKETVNIPGLGEVSKQGVEALAANAPKAPARKTAAKKSSLAKGTIGHAIEQQEKAVAKAAKAKPAAKVEAKADPKDPTAANLIAVFKQADDEGKLPTGAFTAYKLKVRAVLKALNLDLETTDIAELDVEDTIEKFRAASPALLDSTRRSYIDAFRRAARLFVAYLEDPKAWDPTAKAERAPRTSATGTQPTKSQVRKWALEQGHVKEGELGPNYVPVSLYNLYAEAHTAAE